MHDNPQAPSGLAFALPDHRAVSLIGRDAAAFAQAQFMNDVALLEPGQWQWSGWLTPKGRLIALLALLKLSDEAIWLILPDAEPQPLADALKRFVFRSKVVVTARDDVRVSGTFARPSRAAAATLDGADVAAGIELDLGTAEAPRTLHIGLDMAPDDATALARCQVLCEAIGEPYTLNVGEQRLPARIGASIGVTLFGRGADYDDVVIAADVAMYVAKRSGKNRCVLG